MDLDKIIEHLQGKICVDGKLQLARSSASFPVLNPAQGKVFASMPDCQDEDVDNAVISAQKAQAKWKKVPARERGALLHQAAQLLDEHKEELAHLITFETGKAIRTESRVETQAFTDILKFYAGLGSELKGETIPFHPNMLTFTLRQPVGVVAGIIPWNVPLMLMALKIAPAIVAGNSIVIKSAEEAPLAVLRAAELINQVLPPGVLNLLSGYGETCGASLVAHRDVKKVTFTGSVETGRLVYQNAAKKLIPVTLELGGKSPMIVCEDADLTRAVEGAFVSMRFTRQGQSCSAASRILVHRTIYPIFVKKLKERLDQLKIGDPFREETDVGAIISQAQLDKVKHYLKLAACAHGTTLHQCSSLPQEAALEKGLFLQPVIVTDVSPDHPVMQEEIFGPVVCVVPWESFDEALALANATSYGLAATIWTNHLQKALQFCLEIEAGFVQVNQNLVVQANLSYGGIKNSGLGKEASLEAMLEHFTETKTIIMNCQ